jgi:hypothetical protein
MAEAIEFKGREATLLQLELFTTLLGGPQSDAELATRFGLQRARARELFEALADGGLLERRGNRYGNVPGIELLLTPARSRRSPARLPARLGLGVATVLAVFAAVIGLHGRVHPSARASAPPVHRVAAGRPAVLAGQRAALLARLPAAPGTGPAASPVFILVGSAEQAQQVLSARLAEGLRPAPWELVVTNPVAAAEWAHVAPAEVWLLVVTGSGSDDAFFDARLAQANDLRVADGIAPVWVVDLRAVFDGRGD